MKTKLFRYLFAIFAVLGASPFYGQTAAGFHRLGQVLARAPGTVTAQVVPNAKIQVSNSATGVAATIYSDPNLAFPISPPIVTADSRGQYGYYVPPSYCVTETISAPGQGNQIVPYICQSTSVQGAGGNNTQLQYNNLGALGGSLATADSAGNIVSPATITSATSTVTGSQTVGNSQTVGGNQTVVGNSATTGTVSGAGVLAKGTPEFSADLFASSSDGHSGLDYCATINAAYTFINTNFVDTQASIKLTGSPHKCWSQIQIKGPIYLNGNGAILEPQSGGAGGIWGSAPVTISGATLTAGSQTVTYSSTAGLSASMAIGGKGLPNAAYILPTPTTTSLSSALPARLIFEAIPSNTSATVISVNDFRGLSVGQCFTLPVATPTGGTALWTWSSAATQACISSLSISARTVTFDHTITIISFLLTRSPIAFTAVSGTTWTADLTAQAVAPMVQVLAGDGNQAKWQGYRIGANISNLTLADPAFYNVASPNHSLGRSITGVQGIQVLNYDRFPLYSVMFQGLTGTDLILGGDDHGNTYCSSSNSFLGSPRESDYYDVQMWESGDWKTGQPQWLIAGTQCQNNSASDQPNQLDFYGLKAGSPWGPDWVVTSYNSSLWAPSNVPGPRQINCFGCQFEGGGRTNAYASVPARMLDFQIAHDIEIFGGEIAAGTFKYCLICVDNVSSLTLDGVVLGLNGVGSFANPYHATVTNGGTTATFVSGPQSATGFPTDGQFDGQAVVITNVGVGASTLYALPSNAVSSDGQTLTFTAAYGGTTCTGGTPCEIRSMYGGYPILITGALGQLKEYGSIINSTEGNTLNFIYYPGGPSQLQNSFVSGSCPAVVFSDTLRFTNSQYCEQISVQTAWSDQGTPKIVARTLAPNLASGADVDALIGVADNNQLGGYWGYNYTAGAASDTNFMWFGSSVAKGLKVFPSTGVMKTFAGSVLDDASGNASFIGTVNTTGGYQVSGVTKTFGPLRAGAWTISSSTTAPVTFSTAMSSTPSSCQLTTSASTVTTGVPFATSLATSGFTVNVPTSGTISGTYSCTLNNAN